MLISGSKHASAKLVVTQWRLVPAMGHSKLRPKTSLYTGFPWPAPFVGVADEGHLLHGGCLPAQVSNTPSQEKVTTVCLATTVWQTHGFTTDADLGLVRAL